VLPRGPSVGTALDDCKRQRRRRKGLPSLGGGPAGRRSTCPVAAGDRWTCRPPSAWSPGHSARKAGFAMPAPWPRCRPGNAARNLATWPADISLPNWSLRGLAEKGGRFLLPGGWERVGLVLELLWCIRMCAPEGEGKPCAGCDPLLQSATVPEGHAVSGISPRALGVSCCAVSVSIGVRRGAGEGELQGWSFSRWRCQVGPFCLRYQLRTAVTGRVPSAWTPLRHF
jgi:hypothetical protein